MTRRRKVGTTINCRRMGSPPAKRHLLSFFKIILQTTIEDKKMRIPLKFVREYGDKLATVATLTLPSGHVWHMGLTRTNGNIWFDNSWPEFVEHHSIRFGHFLVFNYNGMSNFDVHIFDMTGCEIQYPFGEEPSNNDECSFQHKGDMEADSVEIFGSIPCTNKGILSQRNTTFLKENLPKSSFESDLGLNKRHKHVASPNIPNLEHKHKGEEEADITNLDDLSNSTKGKNVSRAKFYNNDLSENCDEEMEIITSKEFSSICAKASQQSEGAIRAAKMFKPRNPSFMLVMQSYNIKNRTAYVPVGFTRNYLGGVSGYIKFQVSDGREWLIRMVRRTDGGGLNLTRGWGDFSRDNNLKEGDVCVFELFMLENVVLKASIFRACSVGSGLGITKHCRSVTSKGMLNFEHLHETRSSGCMEEEEVEVIDLDDDIEPKEGKFNKNEISSHTGYDEHELSAKQEDIKFITSEKFSMTLAKASPKSKKALQAARMFESNNPSFMVILQPYHINKSIMYVPAEFAQTYLTRVNEHIQIQGTGGREWCIQVRWRVRGGINLVKGWGDFSKDNDLKEGDVCVFELIDQKCFMLKVSIFHVS